MGGTPLVTRPAKEAPWPPETPDKRPRPVVRGESFLDICTSEKITFEELMRFNFQVEVGSKNWARIVNWYLGNKVGCKETTKGGNYKFSGGETIWIPVKKSEPPPKPPPPPTAPPPPEKPKPTGPDYWQIGSTYSGSGSIDLGLSVGAGYGEFEVHKRAEKHKVRWVAVGAGVGLPGLPVSGGISTPEHWSTTGRVYFSDAIYSFGDRRSNELSVFTSKGGILEVGLHSAIATALGLEGLIADIRRRSGVTAAESVSAQILMFDSQLGIGSPMQMIMELAQIGSQIASSGKFFSINIKALTVLAGAQSSIDPGSVTYWGGLWYREGSIF